VAGDLRKEWQDFKKKHPGFEKSKNFKADLGPQLDKYDKALKEFSVLWAALKKKAQDIMGAGILVREALKRYGPVIDELAKSDHTIKADFAKLGLHGLTNMDRLPKEVNQAL
jgi:hypothetical protein